MWGATALAPGSAKITVFQSTRPVWGATVAKLQLQPLPIFQSTRPVWGATLDQSIALNKITIFQSTRPVWGATNADFSLGYPIGISIHAPRVGRDQLHSHQHLKETISIHAPRVGRDFGTFPNMRGGYNFNPRAPCGARLLHDSTMPFCVKFQSTRPVWGATLFMVAASVLCPISIHAPRVGRDDSINLNVQVTANFNPRAPCGARQHRLFRVAVLIKHFNPRAPCGARRKFLRESRSEPYFNPRAPCGARLYAGYVPAGRCQISIHAPRVGRDGRSQKPFRGRVISIHAPRVGRDANNAYKTAGLSAFQSTRPVWGATYTCLLGR